MKFYIGVNTELNGDMRGDEGVRKGTVHLCVLGNKRTCCISQYGCEREVNEKVTYLKAPVLFIHSFIYLFNINHCFIWCLSFFTPISITELNIKLAVFSRRTVPKHILNP